MKKEKLFIKQQNKNYFHLKILSIELRKIIKLDKIYRLNSKWPGSNHQKKVDKNNIEKYLKHNKLQMIYKKE